MSDEYKPVAIEQGGIKLSDISEMGAIVPAGRYKVRLSSVQAKDSKAGTPMVVAAFEIIDGTPADSNVDINSLKGLDTTAFYSMYVGKSEKNGRTIAPGIMEVKAAAAAVGKPLDDDYIFPGNVKEAAKLVHDTLHPRSVGELEAVVIEEADRVDKTKKRNRTRIIGRWGASGDVQVPGVASSAPASTFV